MDKESHHFRAPVSDTFRKKSPFGQLLEHMERVSNCIDILGDGLVKYYKGDYSGFSKISENVSTLEHEADLIKSNLRNHLPTSLFMPVDKGKFMWALREQDKILDHAESLVKMLNMRHTKIPKSLQKPFIDHAMLVMKTVKAMEEAVEKIRDLVETSFVKRERDLTKEFIYKVHRLEWEADKKKYEMTKEIYKLEKNLDPMDEYHL
jgi:hypothetical protein